MRGRNAAKPLSVAVVDSLWIRCGWRYPWPPPQPIFVMRISLSEAKFHVDAALAR
jgi:hypothetical protein